MSYILDALKKSERERGAVTASAMPGAQGGEAQEAVSAWPLLALAAGLVALGAGLSWFLLADRSHPAPMVLPAAPLPASIETTDTGRDLVGETRVAAPPLAAVSAPVVANVEAASAGPRPGPAGDVPFMRSLPDEVRRSLPEMTVNIHVYTPDESRRMLYINNHEYRRGEFVGSVLIEDIVPDGVLMNYHGLRFKLERPR